MLLIKRELPSGERMYCSEVQKTSDNGISRNRRLFVLVDKQFICYLKNPILDAKMSLLFLKENAKGGVRPIQDIKKVISKVEDRELIIRFWNNKQWKFRMECKELVIQWSKQFNQELERSRKGTENKEITISQENGKDKKVQESIRISVPNQQKKEIVSVKQNAQYMPLSKENIKNTLPNNINQQPVKKEHQQINQESYASLPNSIITKSNNLISQQNQNSKIKQQISNIVTQIPKFQFNIQRQQNKKIKNILFATDFRNYYRPYQSIDYTKYYRFIQYCKYCVRDLFDTPYFKQSSSTDTFQESLTYSGVSIKWGWISLKKLADTSTICDDSITKQLRIEQKNKQYLYNVIRNDPLLNKVFYLLMSCMVYYKGVTFFITSLYDATSLTLPHAPIQIQQFSPFERLAQKSKVSFDLFQNQNCIKFIPLQSKRYLIQSVAQCMPLLQSHVVIRNRAFTQAYRHSSTRKEHQKQIAFLMGALEDRIRELSNEMDKLQCYPMHPIQLKAIFHSYGINLKYICKVHALIKNQFCRNLLVTELALRSIKVVVNMKIQSMFKEEGEQQKIQNDKIIGQKEEQTCRKYLNNFLGDSNQSTLLWKVVALHGQKYFKLHIDKENIDKGYFLKGLSHHLNINIYYSKSFQQIFSTNQFIQKIHFQCNHQSVNLLNNDLRKIEQQWYLPPQQNYIQDKLQNDFMQYRDRPLLIMKMRLLQMYNKNIVCSTKEYLDGCSWFYFQRRLLQIKWMVKEERQKTAISLQFQRLREQLTLTYGKFHPFHSEILQLQSIFNRDHSYLKQSLSIIVHCCSNPKHIRLANCYFVLGQSYKDHYQIQDSLGAYLRAKNILQVNSYEKNLEYAVVMHRIGKLYLTTYRDKEAQSFFEVAATIYDPHSHSEQLMQLYEDMWRSGICGRDMIIENCIKMISVHYGVRDKFQGKELERNSLLQRCLRLAVEHMISAMPKHSKEKYKSYIIDKCQETAEKIECILELLLSNQLQQKLYIYIIRGGQMLAKMEKDNKMKSIKNGRSKQVEEFEKCIQEICTILGEGFMIGVIK